MFATFVPVHSLRFAGGYDNVLLLGLFVAVVVDRPVAAAITGVVLGMTHAEIGAVAVLGLVGLAWCGLGPPVRQRLWTLAGIAAGRIALTVWLATEHVHGDRLDFITAYGVSRLVHEAGRQWWLIAWEAAGAGWVIVAAVLLRRRSAPVAAIVGATVLATAAVVAVTVDESRVAGLMMFTTVVALAAYGGAGRRHRAICAAAALVTLLVPWHPVFDGVRVSVAAPFRWGW
jgi:hypothetical protein